MLLEVEGEIELRRRPFHVHRPQAQILDLQAFDRSVLQDEHHLEQGGVGEAPLRSQLLDQALERDVLMGIGGESGLAHPAEKLAERGVPEKSPRRTSVLTKNPIRSSISSRLRPATGVPTARSS